MKTGTLHRHAIEVNVLMALFGSAWEAGLKPVREVDRNSIPLPSLYRQIDFSGLSDKLGAVSGTLNEKIAELEVLTRDAAATNTEKHFTKLLLDYCRLFGQSVNALNRIYAGLHERSVESLVHKYSAADYERDVAIFHEASRQHKAAGALVGDLYGALETNDSERETMERHR